MLVEEERFAHEELEQLEIAISQRQQDNPVTKRERLNKDHDIHYLLERAHEASTKLAFLYNNHSKNLTEEIEERKLSVYDEDSFQTHFMAGIKAIREHHHKYPGEPREDLAAIYKKKPTVDDNGQRVETVVDKMFSGEEAYGRYFDLESLHQQFINLPDNRHPTYVQYLSHFDKFEPPVCTVSRANKVKDAYFQFVGDLAKYLESFMRRIRPLENIDKLLLQWRNEFDDLWDKGKIEGCEDTSASGQSNGSAAAAEPFWCDDCAKGFSNDNVYKSHFSGKKHRKNAEQRKLDGDTNGANGVGGQHHGPVIDTHRLKQRAVAEREFRVKKLAGAMKSERSDTTAWIERKLGMTDKERQQEMEGLMAESEPVVEEEDHDDEEDGEEKVYNPLKLPLQWDGKPIPYWLYKLHGLGVEHPCEICGNYVYMGRRAFERHFTEARHVFGLKCLGITNTGLFREITSIEEAQKLFAKIEGEKKKQQQVTENVVQMEDSEGNVMPEKIYYDLQKQGLI